MVTCTARSGRASVSSCSVTKEMEVAHVTDSEGARDEQTLGEMLRLGSLLEDGLSYKESFVIRCYEVGVNKTATVETIANLLQVCVLEFGNWDIIRYIVMDCVISFWCDMIGSEIGWILISILWMSLCLLRLF